MWSLVSGKGVGEADGDNSDDSTVHTLNYMLMICKEGPLWLIQALEGIWLFGSLRQSTHLRGNKSPIFPSGGHAAAAAKLLQSCPTLCHPIDGSPPVSPVPGILQARTLEWIAISFSNTWKWKVKGKSFSRVRLLATSWTAAYQTPPSMGFSRQDYWSGMPLPSPSHTLSPT